MLMFLFLWSYDVEMLACLLASLLPRVVSIYPVGGSWCQEVFVWAVFISKHDKCEKCLWVVVVLRCPSWASPLHAFLDHYFMLCFLSHSLLLLVLSSLSLSLPLFRLCLSLSLSSYIHAYIFLFIPLLMTKIYKKNTHTHT